MSFVPRLSSPSSSDKNYIHTTGGGYNYCIMIEGYSVLPNCVGYAWGRWREILNKFTTLSRGNAEIWWGNTGDGYSRGSTPKIGAVICWRKGVAGVSSDGAGHVGIVERINDDGTITVSNSAYKSTKFYLTTLRYPYNVGTNYFFQGFIYLPSDVVVDPDPSKSITELANEVINGVWGNNPDRKNRLEAAGYDYDAVQNEVNSILSSPSDLKVGDKVKIVAVGNASSDGSGNTAFGVGYERYILNIYDDRLYPYQVGNDSGTTGFYQKGALTKI